MKHTSRRKSAKRRCKRLVAALAGAAVVTSAMLPGLPLSQAHAAENTAITVPSPGTEANPPTEDKQDNNKETTQENAVNHDRDKERPGEQQSSPVAAVKAAAAAYGFDARHDSFSLQWNSSTEGVVMVRTDKGKTFKVRLIKTAGDWKISSVTEVVTGGQGNGVIHLGDPVEVVKDNAATFGFDAYDDSFTLLSMAGSKAIVQVKTSGQTFKVDLERSGSNWIITTIRGIGNSNYPATYRPASLYGYPATAPVTTVTNKTLYNNNSFADWTWHESAYPADMKVGVLLFKPESAAIADIPGIIVDKVEPIDFSRQLVLYAHIGSVASKGYGIGIENVVQTGNDLTVTIRTKSPLENHRLSPTINNDVISLDRLTLNFDNPIHIQFVDQKGTALSNYTLYRK
ncbi:hypothetical protein [Sporomusa sp. KB1]|jgi:hypothetical protein|uniref:hypothetical protein n=1 Tax=Sporomusa sp. KB1 TaxID=943346 RepID=UPI0011A8536F|nr:hypothetical protein [Sporomusa sp. KB1]TWH45429.1 hypothetical protein Salpa_1340 [Sporomusa sp. KB1]